MRIKVKLKKKQGGVQKWGFLDTSLFYYKYLLAIILNGSEERGRLNSQTSPFSFIICISILYLH